MIKWGGLPTDRYSQTRQFKPQNERNWKTKQVKRPGDRGQHFVESEDKNCASYNWNIRNPERNRSEPSVASGSPVGHIPTEDHADVHCTHLS